MHKWIWGMGLMVSLTACVGISGDGRLTIGASVLATDYRIAGTNTYVGCDELGGRDAVTHVRATFHASGYLKTIDIGLEGLSDHTYDRFFKATFQRSRAEFTQDSSNNIRVIFEADASLGQFLPTSTVSSQRIVVTPNLKTKIKEVQVRGADRVGQGFNARVVATSDQDSPTGVVYSVNNIAVYSNCTLDRTTTEDL